MSPRVVVCDDAAQLADTVARRLLAELVELQAEQDDVRVCLTGGTIANKIYERVAELVAESGVDVDRLAFWWGDERFVPAADEDRNARQALRHLGGPLLGATFHPVPASDQVETAAAAAEAYAAKLPREFHLELLGVGPDGHCLSVFPDHPSFEAAQDPALDVIAVEDSPKPPPTRVSLTLAAASRTQRLWIVASGREKAPVVARALRGDALLPSAHPRGTQETVWFLDEAAASAR